MEKTLSSLSTQPNIKKYSNVIHFIRDYYQYRKGENESFTFDLWSAELGFKSRSFMYMIYSGKRLLTPNFVDLFSTALKFSPAEKEHLLLLSYYHKAKSATQKAAYLDRILENLESNEKNIETQHHAQFLSSSLLPLIKLILAFDDVKGTENELAALLRVNKNTLKEHLALLEKIGLVACTYVESKKDKVWKATSKAFVVPHGGQNEAINLYHQRTMEEASDVIQQQILLHRFRSIFFALSDHNFPDLLGEIENFLTKVKNKYGCDELRHKRLIKLNLQAYAVTESLENT